MEENKKKIKIAAIVGPTASGKTALSIALAKKFGGEIVSCDSMQIYRKMDIGTAKPSIKEMDGIPHHMIDICEPNEKFSCSDYAEKATACIYDIVGRGKLPIICGGTGLYLDSLLRGVRDDNATEDKKFRDKKILEKNDYLMCESKYAKRYKSPFVLTDKGNEAGKKIADKINGVLDEISVGLTEEERIQFYKSLAIISSSLENIVKMKEK